MTGLRRYANKRDASEKAIVDFLRRAGCSVVPLDKPVDLIVGFRGATYLVEIKTGKKGYTEGQEKFFEQWRGSPVVTLRTIEQAITVLRDWRIIKPMKVAA